MRLGELLQGAADTGFADREIKSICSNSKQVTPGCLFVCIKGEHFDGHSAAAKAVEEGAVCVVCEHDLGLSEQVIVPDSRRAYGIICGNWFGNPARDMTMIGVTGTNGKTTVTTLIKHILTEQGYKVGLIGTIRNEIGSEALSTGKTTPDHYELQELFARMKAAGCTHVVMEASSHALDQYRLGATPFAVGVFTNFTQDHLDYHKTMEAYFEAKCRLFEMTKSAVINLDDPKGRELLSRISCQTLTCGSGGKEDLSAEHIDCKPSGVQFTLLSGGERYPVSFAMPGRFSVDNALCAIGALKLLGVPMEKIIAGVKSSHGVKGRCEVIPTGRDFTVLCDYAHSPDGLENVLPAVKSYTTGRLITVFGCGGDRDKLKRPLMGAAAARHSDYLVVTSDNPRTEDPDAIISDILPGIAGSNTAYTVITDRRAAIAAALKMAKAGDVIVLAGKGHEDYQVLGTKKVHFDEREVVAELLREL